MPVEGGDDGESPLSNHPPPCNRGSPAIRGRAERSGLLVKGIPLEDRRSKRYPSSWRTIRAGAGRSIPRAVRSDGRPRSRPRRLDARNRSRPLRFSSPTIRATRSSSSPGGGDLLTAAALLGDAVQRARRHLPEELGAEVVHLALAPEQVLSLISAATPLGTWQAGLTTSSPRTKPCAWSSAPCKKPPDRNAKLNPAEPEPKSQR